MRARMGLAVGSALVALTGCGSSGSTEGFVSSSSTITVVPVAERVPAPELAGLDLQGQPLSTTDLRADSRVLVLGVGGFLGPRLEEIRRILHPTGTLYLHLDYREAHYVKLLLDELFGRE